MIMKPSDNSLLVITVSLAAAILVYGVFAVISLVMAGDRTAFSNHMDAMRGRDRSSMSAAREGCISAYCDSHYVVGWPRGGYPDSNSWSGGDGVSYHGGTVTDTHTGLRGGGV
jgi:hypothetical protein